MILDLLEQDGVVAHPRLGLGDFARRQVEGALVEPAVAERDRDGAPVPLDEELHERVVGQGRDPLLGDDAAPHRARARRA